LGKAVWVRTPPDCYSIGLESLDLGEDTQMEHRICDVEAGAGATELTGCHVARRECPASGLNELALDHASTVRDRKDRLNRGRSCLALPCIE